MRKVQTAASLRVLQCFLLHGSIQQWYGVGKDEEDEAKEKLCLAFLLSPETVNQHSAAAYTQVNGNSRLPHVKYRGCAAGSESAASACALAAITQTTAGQFFFSFLFFYSTLILKVIRISYLHLYVLYENCVSSVLKVSSFIFSPQQLYSNENFVFSFLKKK